MRWPQRQTAALVVLIGAMIVAAFYARTRPHGLHMWIAPLVMVVAPGAFLAWLAVESHAGRRGRPRGRAHSRGPTSAST